jgi:hypothetical protein
MDRFIVSQTYKTKDEKKVLVEIQHPKLSEPVVVCCDQYPKLHHEYHQHVQQRGHEPA